MKLYHLNPNSYGQEWFVVAESREKALEYILEKLLKEAVEADKHNMDLKSRGLLYAKGSTCERDNYLMIKKFSETGSFREYTLDEYNVGEVVQSEIA